MSTKKCPFCAEEVQLVAVALVLALLPGCDNAKSEQTRTTPAAVDPCETARQRIDAFTTERKRAAGAGDTGKVPKPYAAETIRLLRPLVNEVAGACEGSLTSKKATRDYVLELARTIDKMAVDVCKEIRDTHEPARLRSADGAEFVDCVPIGTAGPAVSLSNYSKLQVGDTLEQARTVFGSDGQEAGNSEMAGVVTTTYKWDGPGASGARLMFQNGKLLSKSQAGL